MKTSLLKLTWRTVRTFFGRYMALFLIVAISVGFFSGLKITRSAMANTCEDYLSERHFYDFRLYSTLGFTDEDVLRFSELPGIEKAQGAKSVDVLMRSGDDELSLTLLSMPETVNLPSLTAGKMPENETECLADANLFSEKDIGTVLTVASENKEDVTGRLAESEVTIVGLADSPLYLSRDRGSTDIGNGSLDGFLFLPKGCFTGAVYTEISLTLKETAKIYSDEYEKLIEREKDKITDLAERLAGERYQEILTQNGIAPEMAEQVGITAPEVYVLTRNENAGYVSFESDTSIVSGVANMFPLFFVLIAMLVCVTTMTRMVDEERTQIGVLKALGFRNGAIIGKYLLYAGSATVLGWAAGYFLCTWGLPQIFWFAYGSIYHFAPLKYLWNPALTVGTLGIALAGILGSTYISCRRALMSVPAELIRPRAAKKGKRIFLEAITPLWKRLPFLEKITLRNMFRYKRRLIMMLIGIGCSAGLVVTAFGVRDSMIHIGTKQFEEIETYDAQISFDAGSEAPVRDALDELREVKGLLMGYSSRVDAQKGGTSISATLLSFEDTDRLSTYWHFRSGDDLVALPGNGEAIISAKIAERLSLSVGDAFELRDTDRQTHRVTVSGIFTSFIDNFVFLSPETYENGFGDFQTNTALLKIDGEPEAAAEKLISIHHVTGVSMLSDTKESVDSALSCLNYIIWLVVLFSGALAFIVIFNLTNINLTERSREVATVEVLGFTQKETETYILRENLVLSVLAAFVGLPLGTAFHRVVMRMIDISTLTFDVHVTSISYVLAFLCTVLFAVIVNALMRRQIGKIQMAESLKAVE